MTKSNNEKLRLFFVIPTLECGGAERVLCELANELSERGYQVEICVTESRSQNSFFQISRLVKVSFFDSSFIINRCGRLFGRLLNSIKLVSSIQRSKPNVIVSFMSFETIIAARICGRPIVLSLHSEPEFLWKLIGLPLRILLQGLVSQADSVTVLNEDFKQQIWWSPTVTTLPNPVKTSKSIKTTYFNAPKKIVSIGRLVVEKNQKLLITGFAELARYNPDLSLYIYGEGPERFNLLALISEYSLEKQIFLPGKTDDSYKVLFDADLAVFPSITEGFGLAVCEAMSCGVPVIGSDCVAHANLIQNRVSGLLFRNNDVSSFVQVLKEAIDDYATTVSYVKNAIVVSNKYQTSEIVMAWENLIEFLISKKRSGYSKYETNPV